MDLQIDDFYKDAAGGLLALYQAFPRKIALYVEDSDRPGRAGRVRPSSKRHQSCLGALLWLADEGYLRFESTIQFSHWTSRADREGFHSPDPRRPRIPRATAACLPAYCASVPVSPISFATH